MIICEVHIGSHLSSSATVSTHDANQDPDDLGDKGADNVGDEDADSNHNHDSYGKEGGTDNSDDGSDMYHNQGESFACIVTPLMLTLSHHSDPSPILPSI